MSHSAGPRTLRRGGGHEAGVQRRAAAVSALITLLALGLFALLPPPSLTTAPDRAAHSGLTVEALERDLMRALQARNRARLDELIAADCEVTGPDADGNRVGKHAYVAAALDPARLTIDDFRFTELTATEVASDIVHLGRATLERRGWARGRRADEHLLLTDVWKQRSGRWQLVSRHASAVR